MTNIIYVAINKQTKKIMPGAKGQYAFKDIGTLNRSLVANYAHKRLSWEKGVAVKNLYSIHEIDVNMILPKEDVQ